MSDFPQPPFVFGADGIYTLVVNWEVSYWRLSMDRLADIGKAHGLQVTCPTQAGFGVVGPLPTVKEVFESARLGILRSRPTRYTELLDVAELFAKAGQGAFAREMLCTAAAASGSATVADAYEGVIARLS